MFVEYKTWRKYPVEYSMKNVELSAKTQSEIADAVKLVLADGGAGDLTSLFRYICLVGYKDGYNDGALAGNRIIWELKDKLKSIKDKMDDPAKNLIRRRIKHPRSAGAA